MFVVIVVGDDVDVAFVFNYVYSVGVDVQVCCAAVFVGIVGVIV